MKYTKTIQDAKENKVKWEDVEEVINNVVFTEEEIKHIIDDEYKIFESINKRHSSINEFNKAEKENNEKIIKDSEKYKLISDGDVFEIFDTKEDVKKFLEREKAMMISMTNAILHGFDEQYTVARMSLMYHNLQKASDEVSEEFSRLAEINNRVNQEEELICVGNHVYFNMGDNYIKMNIHDFTKTTVKEVDYSDFVVTKGIQKNK